MTFHDCPQCGAPAELSERGFANGSPIPARMVRLDCAAGHWFLGAAHSFGLPEVEL